MNAGETDASGSVPYVYFAQNDVLPQGCSHCVYLVKVPWILISGSYPGECRCSTIKDTLLIFRP